MMKRIVLLLIILVTSTQGFSQFKNSLLDSDLSGDPKPSGAAVSISPRNKNNIVATAGSNKIYYSTDAGATWLTSEVPSTGSSNFADPLLIADHKGRFYFYHRSDGNNMILNESDDGGKSWTSGEPIGESSRKKWVKPGSAFDKKNNFCLSWTEFDQYMSDDPNCASRILFSQSSNGKKWSRSVVISQLEGDCKYDENAPMGASPIVTADGLCFIAWANDHKIFIDRSFDGGTTWLSNDLTIEKQNAGWILSIPGVQKSEALPVLASDNAATSKFKGALFLVWADQRDNKDNTDVLFTRSMNHGDNWTAPVSIGDNESRRHQFEPSMAVDPSTGYVYIVYFDRSAYDDNQTDVALAWSTDGGGTFRTTKISESPFKPDAEIRNGISANNGVVAVVWTRLHEGTMSFMTAVIKHSDLQAEK